MNTISKHLIQQADSHYLAADFQKAESSYKDALAANRTEDLESAQIRHQLGIVYTALAQYNLAEEHFTAAQNILEKNLGTSHPLVAMVLRHLAKIHKTKNNAEADKFNARAAEIWHEYLNPAALSNADANDFDTLYGQATEEEIIELLHAGAKQNKDKQSLFGQPFTSTALYELAQLEDARGNYRLNKKYLLKAFLKQKKLVYQQQ